MNILGVRPDLKPVPLQAQRHSSNVIPNRVVRNERWRHDVYASRSSKRTHDVVYAFLAITA